MLYQRRAASIGTICLVFCLLLALGLTAEAIATSQLSDILNRQVAAAQEVDRPADIALTVITPSDCPECITLDPVVAAVKREHVQITSERQLQAGSQEADELISTLGIQKLPTMVLTGELEKETSLHDLLKSVGTIKGDTFFLTDIGGPFYDLNQGVIRGEVQMTMISDASCVDCYDVSMHRDILKNVFEVSIEDDDIQTIDVSSSEGKTLIRQYQISLVPTIILTGDLGVYDRLKQVWQQVGTIEPDGAYVMRNQVKQMGTYRDLSSGKIVKASQ